MQLIKGHKSRILMLLFNTVLPANPWSFVDQSYLVLPQMEGTFFSIKSFFVAYWWRWIRPPSLSLSRGQILKRSSASRIGTSWNIDSRKIDRCWLRVVIFLIPDRISWYIGKWINFLAWEISDVKGYLSSDQMDPNLGISRCWWRKLSSCCFKDGSTPRKVVFATAASVANSVFLLFLILSQVSYASTHGVFTWSHKDYILTDIPSGGGMLTSLCTCSHVRCYAPHVFFTWLYIQLNRF